MTSPALCLFYSQSKNNLYIQYVDTLTMYTNLAMQGANTKRAGEYLGR